METLIDVDTLKFIGTAWLLSSVFVAAMWALWRYGT